MKRLILIRHAKSSWSDPLEEDHARPLNARGRESAEVIGEWLKQEGYLPDAILSSDSARTRETAALLNLGTAQTTFTRELYHASCARLLQALQSQTADTVLMLAHNPGIGEFAFRLLAERPAHSRFLDYPTCATLVADFDVSDWAEVELFKGKARAFITPRELLEG